MPIKKYLKSLGITLKDFAERIDLSRPTLNSYIDMYDRGEELPRDRYQIIFDELFANKEKNKEEFEATLLAFEELLKQDARYGVSSLGAEEADIITNLLYIAKKDLGIIDWDSNIYVFINIVISHYRNLEVLRYLAMYFNVLNGLYPAESVSDEEKPYLAILFHAFSKLVKQDFDNYETYYGEFLVRREELNRKRKERIKNQREMVNKKIKAVVEQADSAGISLSEEEILERLINSKKKR